MHSPEPPPRLASRPPLLLDHFCYKHRFVSGVARGSEQSQSQYRKDWATAVAELDGLMAVNTFLDERQSNTSSPSSSSPETPPNFKSPVGLGDAPEYATSLSDDDLMPSESEHTKQAISESPSTSSKQPADARWAAIRSLRSEMDYHHRLFQTMDAFNDDPIITQLRQYFRTSNELRSIGIGVFKDVLHGYQPDKLEEIFAFASLSYSISQLLYRQKKIEEIDILRGVRLWRDTIRKPEEREAFNKIAQHLWWKEARHHLHFIPVHPLASDGRAKEPPEARDGVVSPTMASLSAYIKPGTASMTQMPTEFTQGIEPGGTNVLKNPYTADLFDDAIGTGTQSHDTLGFSDFSDIDLDDDAWIPQLDFMSTHQLMSDIENSRLQQPCPKKPSNMLEIPQQGQSNGADSPSQTCGSESEKPSLKDTCIFLLVLVFLKEAHDLLYKFSWCGQLSKLPLDLYTQRDAHARFLKLAEEQFFEPRSRDKSLNKDYRAMLSLAKAFAEEPFFKTVDEIKHYLVGIAGAIFPPGEQFNHFLQWVQHDPVKEAGLKRKLSSEPLREHKSRRIVREGAPKCPECGKSCSGRLERIRKHMETNHPGVGIPAAYVGRSSRK